MENKIKELCEKIDKLRVGEEFRVKSNCKGIICDECPFLWLSCDCITNTSFDTYQAVARKWLEDNKLEDNKPVEQEQPKTYNIIEALNLPAGTKFKITISDGCETTGYVEKYGEKEDCICLKLLPSEQNANVTGYYINATYTVIEDKPLSFFEAVEQADKKRFKIEHELYKIKDCHTLLTHTNFLKELNNNEIKEIMLNAKCYLE